MGSFDWMESGRLSAHTLWSEDWFGDQSAQTWSLYGDLLRSASMLGQQKFGSYVIGASIGGHPSGATYKMLSLIGHGGKGIDVYTFGPNMLFGDGWSENWWVYPPLAKALRLVGRGERLLYPGRPERGKVAIFLPSSSALWETDQHQPHYNQEMWGLHHALIYAGYTVDFVDDTDLAQGALVGRGYTTLYLTGPNVAREAQEQVKAWVQSGGTLVVTPGAAVADEYNTPTSVLDPILGLKNRVAVRDAAPQVSDTLPVTDTVTLTSTKLGTGSVDLHGPITALTIDRAAVLASLKSGGAGITANQYGKGRAIAYAFFPGWQYWLTPDRTDRSRLPLKWGAAERNLIVAPVRIAGTPRPVTMNREGVEACRLQSGKGIAVVLLNWTDQPIASLTVTVPATGKFHKVSSAQGAAVKSTVTADGIQVILPVKDVDVLMIE
jgi:hypothetical protein